jgi:S1-C subfamily serine protease
VVWRTEAFLTSFGAVRCGAVRCRQDAFTLDVPQGSGSGFVWDKIGHIVTNFHVIRGASDLRLVPSDV